MTARHAAPDMPAPDGAEPGEDASSTDQLSLRLDADRPGSPRALRPMLPRPIATPFDDPDHLFEPWWGGERAFAFVDVDPATGAGTVRIVDRRGRDRAALLPELTSTGGLVGRLGGHAALLDGSLVVVDAAGRPDPEGLAARLAGRAGGTVVFLAFDLVALDGRPLLAEPLERRRERLERTVEPGGSVLVVPAIPGEGRALHAAATTSGIPGVIGRHRRSPYLPGVRSRLWRLAATGPADGGEAGGGGPAEAAPGDASGTTPILALIQRLPLDHGD
jgi:bifunctional non-homologous end joining protein LigD